MRREVKREKRTWRCPKGKGADFPNRDATRRHEETTKHLPAGVVAFVPFAFAFFAFGASSTACTPLPLGTDSVELNEESEDADDTDERGAGETFPSLSRFASVWVRLPCFAYFWGCSVGWS